VKLAVLGLAMLAGAMAAPALAQGSSGDFAAGFGRGPDTQVLGFIRIPIGEDGQKKKQPRIGFGVFTDCSRLEHRLAASNAAACDAEPIRSLEFTRKLYDTDWLLSFRGEKRWVGIARWYPGSGFARVREYGPILDQPVSSKFWNE
jgi:hypothetical protein